jgi:nucleotide-binding universal stress UspA family protein
MSTAAIGLDPSRHGSLDRMAMPAGTADLSRIVHATDFSAAGEPAFDHALRLAVAAKSHFYLVHARHLAPGQDADWAACPGVRSTLGRWGFLPAGAAPAEVHERLGVRVTKAEVPDRDPVDGVLRFVADNLGNLLVLATHARDDATYWLRGSVAETLARRAQIPTLFLPYGSRGFVEHATGMVTLHNILLPADRSIPSGEAAALGLRLADTLGGTDAILHLLHVGPVEDAPITAVEEGRLRRVQADGPVVDAIAMQAEAVAADLVVMPTQGHDGLLDHLLGSTTEQAHRIGRPLLAVPAG